MRVLLVSNWYWWRIYAIDRIAGSAHDLVAAVVHTPTGTGPPLRAALRTLMPERLRRDPDGGKVINERRRLQRSIRKHKIPLLEIDDINTRDVCQKIAALQPEAIVTLGWPQKLASPITTLPPRGCINCHPSLLPRHRGRFPFTAAILDNDTHTGITFHLMNEVFDGGDILLQKKIEIDADDNGLTLSEKCGQLALDMLLPFLTGLQNKHFRPVPQDESRVTNSRVPTQEDAQVDWLLPSHEIARRVRAYFPWFHSYTNHGQERIAFFECAARDGLPADVPGTVLAKNTEGLVIGTGRGSLLMKYPAVAGMNAKQAFEYINETVHVGDVLSRDGRALTFSQALANFSILKSQKNDEDDGEDLDLLL